MKSSSAGSVASAIAFHRNCGACRPRGRSAGARRPTETNFVSTWARPDALTPEILNAFRPGVFAPGDSVEVVPTELTVEETVRIWEVIAGQSYVLSVPFVLRTVYVESTIADAQGPVQERAFDVRQLEAAP